MARRAVRCRGPRTGVPGRGIGSHRRAYYEVVDPKKRDMDERVNLEMDPEDALRGLLNTDPDAPPEDDAEPESGD